MHNTRLWRKASLPRRALRRKDLVEAHFPLAQPEADDRDLALRIDAYDAARLVKTGDVHHIAGLEPAAPFLERRLLAGFALEVRDFLLELLALLARLVLGVERLLARLLRLLALALQLQ